MLKTWVELPPDAAAKVTELCKKRLPLSRFEKASQTLDFIGVEKVYRCPFSGFCSFDFLNDYSG